MIDQDIKRTKMKINNKDTSEDEKKQLSIAVRELLKL